LAAHEGGFLLPGTAVTGSIRRFRPGSQVLIDLDALVGILTAIKIVIELHDRVDRGRARRRRDGAK
jgi:hypothetical protein